MANESKMHKIQVSKVKSVTHDLLCKLTLSGDLGSSLPPHLGIAITESLIIRLRHHFRLTSHYISNQSISLPGHKLGLRLTVLQNQTLATRLQALQSTISCTEDGVRAVSALSILSIIKPQYTAALLH